MSAATVVAFYFVIKSVADREGKISAFFNSRLVWTLALLEACLDPGARLEIRIMRCLKTTFVHDFLKKFDGAASGPTRCAP